jgi:PAS domain S-box-containing protein
MTMATLLIVDNIAENRDMLSRRLERRGYLVECAEDGQSALNIIASKPIALVLLDVMMPGMSGLEVLQEIRKFYSRLALPVIMVTALSDNVKIEEALRLGANDYVTKPVDFAVALARIEVVEANRQALEESENLLESIFDNIPVGILIKDADQVVERPNNTYLNWYGLASADMVRQRSHEIEDFQPSEDIEIMKDQEQEVLATGISVTRQVERQFADGQRHIVDITKFPVYDKHGSITKVGSVSVDLTELAKAKQRAEEARMEAESANHAKSAFLANMSHELRTPLNAIIGFSETMLAEIFGPIGSEKYSEYAKAISQSGHHLLDLVNDILDMAKIESEPYELSPESFSLREKIADSFQLIQGLADRNGVQLVERLSSAASVVTADKRAMSQILLNLISNAVKFTLEGGSVAVSATARYGDLTLCVEDTGIGISADDIPDLTKPFNQGSRKDSYTAGEGTGLGLSIVASLVHLHHGTLDIHSEVGKGTRVSVVLPDVVPNVNQLGTG